MRAVYHDNHIETMRGLTEQGRLMGRHLKALADKYGYRKLPAEVSAAQRAFYTQELPEFWKNGTFAKYEFKLTTPNGNTLATGVSPRGFVCGDYGVFLEIEDNQINRGALKVQAGEEYRIDNPRYADRVKYEWYTDKENYGIKMYRQVRGVTYADYKPGKWYVSPYEVRVSIVRELDKNERKEIPVSNQLIQGSLFDEVKTPSVLVNLTPELAEKPSIRGRI